MHLKKAEGTIQKGKGRGRFSETVTLKARATSLALKYQCNPKPIIIDKAVTVKILFTTMLIDFFRVSQLGSGP